MLKYLAFALLLAGCAPSADPPPAAEAGSEAELLALNEALFHAMIVERDTSLMAQVALAELHVLAPGGLIENRAQVLAGASVWDATAVQVRDQTVARHGSVAIVMGRLDIDGVMPPIGRWGPLKFMSTFIYADGAWRLLSRSLTPCIDRLVEMGRC